MTCISDLCIVSNAIVTKRWLEHQIRQPLGDPLTPSPTSARGIEQSSLSTPSNEKWTNIRSTDELCDQYFCWGYVALCCQLLCERTSQVYWTCGDMRRPARELNATKQETGLGDMEDQTQVLVAPA